MDIYPEFFGDVNLDPAAVLLGTGFLSFSSPLGIRGLFQIIEDGKVLELLAIMADDPGSGQLKHFLLHCRMCFDEVRILHIMNERLHLYLVKQGFKTYQQERDGDKIDGVRWVAN